MPTYDYACNRCESSATLRFVPVDHPVPKCPVCGEAMTLVLGVPLIQFIGTGWTEKGDRRE